MSGQIQKHDIISEEALKVFKEIVIEFQNLIKAAQKLKGGLKDTGLERTGDDAKKAKKHLSEYEKLQRRVTAQAEKQTKEYQKLNKEYQKNQALINKQNAAIRKQATGNLGLMGSFKKLAKSVAAYALIYVGLTQVVRFFTSTLFNLTKRLDALHFSMKTVIKDSNELIVTQNFLRKTAINYGHDILTLTERYIKFRAAAQQSNLTAFETMAIFDSMAKAAGVLGLKTDEVNGVFLALEQMISKGKVTTEELRRQLGERLPGAMGIMASSMGVTISQLDKMLKAGEVLSAEVLPNFARAVEEAYGIETLNKVETLVAAHGKLTTSWKLFVDELNSSRAYTIWLENTVNVFNRLRIATEWMTKGTNLMEKYMLMTTKAGDAVNKFVTEADKMEFSSLKGQQAKERFIKQLDDEGLTLQHAIQVWNEYYRVRKAQDKIDAAKFDFATVLDFDDEKKRLDQAEKDFKSYTNTRKGELQDQFVTESAFVSDKLKTEKAYLTERAKTVKTESDLAHKSFVKYNAMSIGLKAIGKTLTKDQNIELNKRYDNYQNYLKLRIEINNRLVELNKPKKGKTYALSLLKAQQALELEQLKLFHAQKILNFKGSAEELKQLQYDNDREVVVQQIEDTQEQKRIAGLTKQELLGIEKEYQTRKKDIITLAIDYLNGVYDKDIKDRLKKEKEARDARIAAIYEETNLLNIARQKQATQELLDSSRLQSKKKAINLKAIVDILENEYAAQQQILALEGLTAEERESALQKMADLEIALQEKVRNGIVDVENTKRAEIERTFAFISDIGNKGFEVQQQLSENATQHAKNRYEREMQAAGENESMQLSAKRNLEAEERKIAKRQAIAAKAQAAFNIGLSTAQAIIGIWAQVPKFDFGISAGVLTGIVAAMGAAQLAAALGAPLPQFAEGIENFGGGLAIVGDKKGSPDKAGGSELLKFANGKTALSPSTPTVMNLPPGTDVIPNDETTRILAQSAVTKTYDMVDMSTTNNHLKNISKNTSESVTFENGYKIVRKKGFVGRYKV